MPRRSDDARAAERPERPHHSAQTIFKREVSKRLRRVLVADERPERRNQPLDPFKLFSHSSSSSSRISS
jgi:hypothetical protein